MYQQMIKDLEEKGFEEKGLIGEGAFGRVYRVKKKITKRIYACKLGVGAGKEHVCREAMFLRKISHPLFTKYIEYWEEDGYACFIMEYVAGTSLEDFIRRRNKLSETQTVKITTELAEGLWYLHKHSIIFRDIKPQNIVIRQDGRVKLLDFGCACLRGDGLRTKVGTPGFAPREQLYYGKAEACSDVYALGKVMQYMLSGKKTCMLSAEQYEKMWKKEKCKRTLKRTVNLCVKEKTDERLPDMYVLLRSLNKLGTKSRKFFPLNYILEKNIWESNYKI